MVKNTLGIRHSKAVITNNSVNKSRKLLKLNKDKLKSVIDILSGHGQFKYIPKKLRVSLNEKCYFCEKEIATAEHVSRRSDAN